jgi:hypothetical protein
MRVVRVRHALLGLLLLVVLAGSAAGCDAASSPTGDAGGSGCDHWCGDGSAIVTLGGVTTVVSGGGCYDGGPSGIDARFGDWQDLSGEVSSYLTLTIYRAGGPTPTPAATPAVPADTGHFSPTVSGSVRGIPFILGEDTSVTLDAGGRGSFSGTDVNGYGRVTGTFTCK